MNVYLKRFSWDTPVRTILGNKFVLADPLRTAKLTLRDLLSHRTGLPRNDPLLLGGFTTKELLRFFPLVANFRNI